MFCIRWAHSHSYLKLSLVKSLSCPTPCNTMGWSKPGFPVHHQLPELAQTQVHRIGDAIQSSHSLLSPSLTFNLSQYQDLFQWVSSSHQVARVLEFQHQHPLQAQHPPLNSNNNIIHHFCFQSWLILNKNSRKFFSILRI